jgi:hypothetical protein
MINEGGLGHFLKIIYFKVHFLIVVLFKFASFQEQGEDEIHLPLYRKR